MSIVKRQGALSLTLVPPPHPKKRTHRPRVVVFADRSEAPVRREDSRWKVESPEHGRFSAVTLARLQKDLDAFDPGARVVTRKRKGG